MYQKCSCGASIPQVKVKAWGGKCPRCRGIEQKERRTAPKGYVRCETAGCKSTIPASMKREWYGRCPKCRGIKQEGRKRRPQNSLGRV